jgi:hypothetical protein
MSETLSQVIVGLTVLATFAIAYFLGARGR